MSNRETYPASQSPLQGDISGPAGATLVTVTGFQGIPIQPGVPTDSAGWIYDANANEWFWEIPPNIAIILNGTPNGVGVLTGGEIMSDDYVISVNNVGLEVLASWSLGFGFKVFVNGTGVT